MARAAVAMAVEAKMTMRMVTAECKVGIVENSSSNFMLEAQTATMGGGYDVDGDGELVPGERE